MLFRWNARHGVTPVEAEEVILAAKRPFPLRRGDDRWIVWGPTKGGRLLQVVFVIDEEGFVYVIHARPLTRKEKTRFRKGEKP